MDIEALVDGGELKCLQRLAEQQRRGGRQDPGAQAGSVADIPVSLSADIVQKRWLLAT
jgi:hypothetical protein